MTSARYLTLLWPGLPWLWLRGNRAGLVLACAFVLVVKLVAAAPHRGMVAAASGGRPAASA